MAAFKLAKDHNADIECDLQVTSDGQLVVLHDTTVDRTTNGHGRINDMTAAQARELDAGSWKAPEYAGEKIPLVTELLAFLETNRGIRVTLDMKSTALNMVAILAKDLEKFPPRVKEQLVLGCWDETCMTECLELLPGVAKVFITGFDPSEDNFDKYRSLGLTGFSVRCRWVDGSPVGLSEAFTRTAQAAGFEVYTWTHNTIQDLERMFAWKVNGLVGDYPDRTNEVIGRTINATSSRGQAVAVAFAYAFLEGCLDWQRHGTLLKDAPTVYENFFATSKACQAVATARCPLVEVDVTRAHKTGTCEGHSVELYHEAATAGLIRA